LTRTADATVAARAGAGWGWPALFASTIFLSAFLLFEVQPIAGKIVLPWFGGGSAIWITTLMFFQLALLGGYAYAHLVALRLGPRMQGLTHITLLLVALAVVAVTRILPPDALRPEDASNPTFRLLLVLAVSVGPPYFLLSTTGPLLQHWFAIRYPDRSPYPLYALSNTGSLLALLTYPVVVERVLGLRAQALGFSLGYAAFAIACAAIAWHIVRRERAGAGMPEHVGGSVAEAPPERLGVGRVVLWAALPACASALLLAVSTQLTQDVAGLPLLWVLPLAVYLLTFIATFSSERMYEPNMYTVVLLFACAGGLYVLRPFDIVLQIALYLLVLFLACMSLHGETSRLRPGPRHLTAFYLMVSVGGALGGIAVAVGAPLLLAGYWEYHVALFATPLLVLISRFYEERRTRSRFVLVSAGAIAAALLVSFGTYLYRNANEIYVNTLALKRDFYGSVRVYSVQQPESGREHHMQHGRILHGLQFVDAPLRYSRTGYYPETSAVGLALTKHPAGLSGTQHVGVVGLGAGMIAAYAERGDTWAFYEISPLVTELAEEYFTYLQDARERGVALTIDHGDGRTVLERQLEEAPKQFDVLVLDAFTSDAVPVHLLTREAVDMYWRHLKPDGILAVNISNAYVDLSPVVRGLAEASGRQVRWRFDGGEVPGGRVNYWVVLTNNEAFLDDPAVKSGLQEWPDDAREAIRWTDDYSNLYSVLTIR
jgi:hypothetical protein